MDGSRGWRALGRRAHRSPITSASTAPSVDGADEEVWLLKILRAADDRSHLGFRSLAGTHCPRGPSEVAPGADKDETLQLNAAAREFVPAQEAAMSAGRWSLRRDSFRGLPKHGVLEGSPFSVK